MERDDGRLPEIAGWLRGARSVVVLTGAGMSTESGIPDFRGPQGVWTKDPKAEKLSNLHYYMNDPGVRVASWQARLVHPAWTAQPNAGHLALAELERKGRLDTLVTQNIDGLHQAAGSRDVIELHGNVWRARCFDCDARYSLDDLSRDEAVPSCFDCGGNLRPDVVLFGEMLPPGAFERAADAAQRCELSFVVGTSAVVYPAASIPEIARGNGAYLVEVNPERTPLSDFCDEVLTGKAGEVLPLLTISAPREMSTGSWKRLSGVRFS